MAIRFDRLTIHDWRQFANLDIKFHERLTIITGSNGAGKSTVLRLLAQHFGWNVTLLATPTISKLGDLTYSSGLWDWPLREPQPQGALIGELTYTSGHTSRLRIPSVGSVQYNISIEGQQFVEGVNISSHRPISGYQQINNIPTNALGAQQAYQFYFAETMNRYQNSYEAH